MPEHTQPRWELGGYRLWLTLAFVPSVEQPQTSTKPALPKATSTKKKAETLK